MSPGETKSERKKRQKLEGFRRGALLLGFAGAVVGVTVKYLPNSLTSESVKPPTTTEQVIDNPHKESISSANIEIQP